MPEGPEVAVIADELDLYLCNRVITRIHVLSGRYLTHPIKGLDSTTFPLKILKVGYRGKMVVFHLLPVEEGSSNGEGKIWLFSTLGMTGHYTIVEKEHSRVVFELENSKELQPENPFNIKRFYYNDVRNFGTLAFSGDRSEYTRRVGRIANGLIGGNTITLEAFIQSLKRCGTRELVKCLMNQHSVCSGIGNYLLSEILHVNGLDPFVKCSELFTCDDTPKEQIQKLYESSREMMQRSYDCGGMSMRDYRRFDGSKGSYQSQLLVYGKETDSQGRTIKKITGPHGRTIYFSKRGSTVC